MVYKKYIKNGLMVIKKNTTVPDKLPHIIILRIKILLAALKN